MVGEAERLTKAEGRRAVSPEQRDPRALGAGGGPKKKKSPASELTGLLSKKSGLLNGER